MCGLAASMPSDEGFIAYAQERQGQRGPDQSGTADLGFCSLGVNRLAVSGLIGGDQPLTSPDGSIAVIFNGAIYNTRRLIEDFGFRPKSSNDGELIHFLYQRFGLQFADYLEGMFAVCIADLRTRELVTAVDQVGIKPLYRCEADGRLYLASTIAAFPPSLRSSAVRHPPGIVWSSSGQIERITHFYYKDGPLGALLKESVTEQIPGEVSWGCMLSGGVDSSLIARIATEAVGQKVHTFTCGVQGSPDVQAARDVAGLLGTDHHEIPVDPAELPRIVDEVIRATASIERWTVTAGVATYLTARAAHQAGMKVLLAGEGADELFGGYDEFQDVPQAYLNSMLLCYQVDLGATECLRLDRTSMAHGVEARVPYLSTSIMRHARSLAPQDKIRVQNGQSVRKYALREYARTVLPRHVADRRKEEFAIGSGMTGELARLAAAMFSASDIAELRASFPSFPIDDPLSAWFFSRWLDLYGLTIGTAWGALVERGLFRQPASRYLPNVAESAAYAATAH
jgi:asparagine synthase (glutamine-hydrolysing)